MNDYTGTLYGKRGGQLINAPYTGQDVMLWRSLAESQKKKLDEQAALIQTMRKEILTLQAKVDEMNERNIKERTGLLEEYHDRVLNAETVIELQIQAMKKGGE